MLLGRLDLFGAISGLGVGAHIFPPAVRISSGLMASMFSLIVRQPQATLQARRKMSWLKARRNRARAAPAAQQQLFICLAWRWSPVQSRHLQHHLPSGTSSVGRQALVRAVDGRRRFAAQRPDPVQHRALNSGRTLAAVWLSAAVLRSKSLAVEDGAVFIQDGLAGDDDLVVGVFSAGPGCGHGIAGRDTVVTEFLLKGL